MTLDEGIDLLTGLRLRCPGNTDLQMFWPTADSCDLVESITLCYPCPLDSSLVCPGDCRQCPHVSNPGWGFEELGGIKKDCWISINGEKV